MSGPFMKFTDKITGGSYNSWRNRNSSDNPNSPVRTSSCPGTSKTHMSTFGAGFTPSNIGSQSERTGRRSHKMMSVARRKEPVWPLALEEALLEALRLYRPISKSGRPLRRFTKRNVFISRHILSKTGKSRTPKQVGSRLQQISESSPDAELKKLITNRERGSSPGSPTLYSTTLRLSPTMVDDPSEYTASTISEGDSHEHLTLSSSAFDPSQETAAMDRQTLCSSAFPQPNYSEAAASLYDSPGYNDFMTLLGELISSDVGRYSTAQLGLDADISEKGVNFILSLEANESSSRNSFYNARRLSNIPPIFLFYQAPQLTILSQFLSPEVAYLCTYGVFMDGPIQVHTESVPLLASTAPDEHPSEPHVWRAPILPEYWDRLGRSPILDRYTIMLEISELGVSRSGLCNTMPPKSRFSVALNFKHATDENTCAFYSNATFEEPTLTSVFPFPPNGGLSASSSISNISPSSQYSDSGRMYTWFDPSGSYAQYPILEEGSQANLGGHDQADLSAPYIFAQY